MRLADVPWVPFSAGTAGRWKLEAEITKPDGNLLKIWQGEHEGRIEYAIYPYYRGYEGQNKYIRRLRLDALEAQCLLFHYLGGNDG